MVTPNNEFWGLQTTGSDLSPFNGTLTPSGNDFTAEGNINILNKNMNGLSANGIFVQGQVLSGTSLIAGVAANFNTQYTASYDLAPSLSAIAGTYTINSGGVVVIGSAGIISGSLPNGCNFSGSLSADSSGKNFYRFSITNGAAPCAVPGAAGQGVLVAVRLNELFIDEVTGGVVQGFILDK